MCRWMLLPCLIAVFALPGCASSNTVVVMDTSMGTVKMELFDDDAPISVKNFLQYVGDKHYDGTIFHRVMDGFVIQGGGMDVNGKEKLPVRDPIKLESYNNKHNSRGTLAMARTDDPNSATDQFFINVADNNAALDRKRGPGGEGYAVFGKVIEGMDVVDKIAHVATRNGVRVGRGSMDNVPVEPVIIKSIRRL